MGPTKSVLWVALAVFSCVLGRIAFDAASAADLKPEDQIQQLERDWLAADGKGDAAKLGDLIADDFLGGTSDGKVLSKQDIIPQGGAGGFAGAAPKDTTVRVFGETAVLLGAIEMAGSRETRVTLVCQKRARGWQIIAVQLSHP